MSGIVAGSLSDQIRRDPDLGTVPDRVLAERYGVSVRLVCWQRARVARRPWERKAAADRGAP
jgi:hypothetical protein